MTFPLMKAASIKMYSHRQNANLGDKDEPKYDDISGDLADFYQKAVGELKEKGGSDGTMVTNDLVGHLESGKLTPMAIFAVMNPQTGKYEISTLGIITPADADDLDKARQLFLAPKPKQKRRRRNAGADADGGEEAAPPPAEPPQAEPPAAEPELSVVEGGKEDPPQEDPPKETKGTTKMTELLTADKGEEGGDDVDSLLEAAAEQTQAGAELEAASEARAAAEEEEDDPDLAALFADGSS